MKWAPTDSGVELDREVACLWWAIRYTAVPRVLDTGADVRGTWIVTACSLTPRHGGAQRVLPVCPRL